MVPRIALSMENNSDSAPESSDRKGRVPKKIHKAEREKLKRDHENKLVQELGQTLEPSRQNNGKASILADAAKLLRDLISQVDSLRKENASLQKESRYVTVERNELKDENTVLGMEVERLQIEIGERMQSNPSWSNAVPAPVPASSAHTLTPPTQQRAVIGSMYVVPQNNRQYMEDHTESIAHISRPHPRYPPQTDSWSYQFLLQQPAAESNNANGADCDREAEGPSSPKELLLLF